LQAAAEYRYDISARHYLDGYAYLYQFAAEDRVFGDCPLKPGWVDEYGIPCKARLDWQILCTLRMLRLD